MRAFAFAVLLMTTACSTPADRPQPATSDVGSARKPAARPRWYAEPVARPGLPNLHRVTPRLYRGAQPDAQGMRELAKMGVKTVVNLRSLHSDRDEIGSLPLSYEHINMKAWHPEDEDVVRFLRIVTDESRGPVFVHCQHGADRTGLLMAVYRIVVQGWPKERAIDEMTHGGFGYHVIWKDLIVYLRALDVERIRREAGLAPPR
jgi:protein tyrosine phosphatase (PTP) superfamily phosphohydrolase (DUF442 family)